MRLQRILDVFLAAMLAALWTMPALALPAGAPAHAAGCHSHQPSVPAPAPVNYQCCANGHHWAVVSTCCSPAPVVVLSRTRPAGEFPMPAAPLRQPGALNFSSASPPASPPLRI